VSPAATSLCMDSKRCAFPTHPPLYADHPVVHPHARAQSCKLSNGHHAQQLQASLISLLFP
jgi:hypothetical protein